MTYATENFRKRYVRVQTTIAALCIDEYGDNLTGVVSVSMMLVVTVAGTCAMTALALILCLLGAGLAMTAFIANIAKSPVAQQAWRRCFPGAAGTVDRVTASRCGSLASGCARRTTAALIFGLWFAVKTVGTAMFIAVEWLGPSSRPLSAAGGSVVTTVKDVASLAVSVENPSTVAQSVAAANGTPLPVRRSVEDPSSDAQAVIAADGTPLPVRRSVEDPFSDAQAVIAADGTPLPVRRSVEDPSSDAQAVIAADGTPLPVVCSVEKPSPAARVDTTSSTYKYWKKRHTLFTKFDEGILMDEESFYSVCPETLSAYMAEKCGQVKVAVDPFCGAGGNIIQLARRFDKVIAVDIDADKIVMAKRNAAIYGVLEKIEFVVGDFFKLANQIKGDVMVTSPPWGGPEYSRMDVIGPLDLCVDKILEVGRTIAPKILLHLPKNLDKNECWKMCNGVGAALGRIEDVYMDRYLNSTLLYVRSNNNNAVSDVAPKPVDIHLRNSFRRNERYSLKTYQSYLMDVDTLVSSRRASL